MKILYILLSFSCIVNSCFGQSASTEAAGTCCNGATDWPNKHQALVTQTTTQKANIKAVFVGDSITEGWVLTYDSDWGSTVWNQYYKPRGAYNYGISGDRTNNVLYRISHNEFDGLTPNVVVIMIGTNNIGVSSDDDVATAIKLIVKNLKAKMPSANYLLLGILPRQGSGTDQKVENINKLISGTEGVTFLDMGSHFRTGLGSVNASAYRSDQLHINTKGYGLWHDVMEPTFAKLLG